MPRILSFEAARAARDAARERAATHFSSCDHELLDEAIGLAERLGCEIREEFLGGSGGGFGLLRGRKVVLLDLNQSVREQLDYVADALRGERRLVDADMSAPLAEFLAPRRVA
ncbi:MAG: hypothetical protein ACRCT8_07245 [Lacipirellulaceae bacterium]